MVLVVYSLLIPSGLIQSLLRADCSRQNKWREYETEGVLYVANKNVTSCTQDCMQHASQIDHDQTAIDHLLLSPSDDLSHARKRE